MCRLLAYLGPPQNLADLVFDPPHSLLVQSYAPKLQAHGRMNADGFGVGWWEPDKRAEPARYRSPRPFWTDRSLPSIAGLVRTGALIASVRAATPPLPVDESATHPFMEGAWLFADNGCINDFRGGVGGRLRRRLSDARLERLEGATDSEVLFGLVLDAIDAGAAPAEALATTVALVDTHAGGRLTMVLGNGRGLWATRRGDSFFVKHGGFVHDRGGPGVALASEPYDESAEWAEVPDSSVIAVERGEVTLESIASVDSIT